MNSALEAILLTFGVITPLVLLTIFVSASVAAIMVVSLLTMYKLEAVHRSEARKNRRLLAQIRTGKI